MSLHPRHLRDLVVRPVLDLLALPAPGPEHLGSPAERLVMGTAAQESHLRYLKQLGSGPALGLFQMEPATFRDLWNRFGLKHAVGRELQSLLVPGIDPLDQLTWNLRFSAAMCRVHYFARPFEMPANPSVEDLGEIWKQHYNTVKGKGTVREFVENYEVMVAGIYR